MLPKVSEIEIKLVKPRGGLVAFASFVLNDWLYCGSVAIMTRLDGSYRLCFPTRKLNSGAISVFHPINKTVEQTISGAVLAKYEDVVKGSDDGYWCYQN